MKTEHIDNLIDHANNNGGIDLDQLRKDILFSPPNGPAPIISDVNEATRVGPILRLGPGGDYVKEYYGVKK